MFWITLMETAAILVLLSWLPVMRRAESFFAVPVSRAYFQHDGRMLLRQYRLGLGAAFVVFIGGSRFFLNGASRWILFLPPILMLLAGIGLHTYFHRQIRQHKLPETTSRAVASLTVRRLRDVTSVWLELAVGFLTVVPIVLVAQWYSHLPLSIPVHWNGAGEPDRWAERSFGTVGFLPFMALYLYGLMLLVKVSFLHTKMPLPVQRTADYFRLKEQELQSTLFFMDGLRLMLALLLGTLTLGVLISTLPAFRSFQALWSLAIWGSVSGLVGLIIFYLVRSRQVSRQIENFTDGHFPAAVTTERGWYGGGAFYYNPQDPAIFVEKKIGLGNTLNLAHRQARYFALYLIGGVGIVLLWAFLWL